MFPIHAATNFVIGHSVASVTLVEYIVRVLGYLLAFAGLTVGIVAVRGVIGSVRRRVRDRRRH